RASGTAPPPRAPTGEGTARGERPEKEGAGAAAKKPAVGIGVAVAIRRRIPVTVAVGWVAVTIAIVARIVIRIGRPPQRRADQRADGEGAEAPAPSPTPAGFRRFRHAHGDCAGEQKRNQRSFHGATSLVL